MTAQDFIEKDLRVFVEMRELAVKLGQEHLIHSFDKFLQLNKNRWQSQATYGTVAGCGPTMGESWVEYEQPDKPAPYNQCPKHPRYTTYPFCPDCRNEEPQGVNFTPIGFLEPEHESIENIRRKLNQVIAAINELRGK